MIEPPRPGIVEALFDGEEKPFDVDAEYFIKMGFSDRPQWSEFHNAGVGKENIDDGPSVPLPQHTTDQDL